MKHIGRHHLLALLQQGIVLLVPSFRARINHLRQKLITATGHDHGEHGAESVGEPRDDIVQPLLNAFDHEPTAPKAFS